MTSRRFFISLICVVLLSPLAAETCLSQSAWQELIRQNPTVLDDPSIDWQQRLILNALTPDQARRYYQGTSAEDLMVRDGQTLSEYLAARLNPMGNVYVPLPGACELFSVEDLLVDESLSLQVRGRCGIPEEATAVILQVKAESLGGSPRVKMWASDLPEPAEAVVEGSNNRFEDLYATTTVVSLCEGDQCPEGELQLRGTDAAMVQAEAVGYFRLINPSDGVRSGPGIMFATEGGSNNYFGTNAGGTSGGQNSFFGGSAGDVNTGNFNSAFGYHALSSNTTGGWNTAIGDEAMLSNVSGAENVAVGADALRANTSSFNTAVGDQALQDNTSGLANTALGEDALLGNTDGSYNTALGSDALRSNTTASNNTAVGRAALHFNSTGENNTAVGEHAGYNVQGSYNTFSGFEAGYGATSGTDNTGHFQSVFGYRAGYQNTAGYDNAFFGDYSGHANTTGTDNTFLGSQAGQSNTIGNENTFAGERAGVNNDEGYNNSFLGSGAGYTNLNGYANTFLGHGAGYYHTSGARNTFVGRATGPSITNENFLTLVGAMSDGSAAITNATAVGYQAKVTQSNSLVLGSINGVNGATASTQVGIGTTAPQRLLHIAGSNAVFRMDRSTNSAAFMLVRTDGGGGILKNFVIGVDASGANQGEFVINDLGTALGGPGQRRLTINNGGDVIINGSLITNTGALSIPDYVFAKDYELMPLGELKEYVGTQKHLPEIPSAGEIEEQGGINVTELQLKLLQKIEELTLYTIEQQETSDHQHATIEQLKEQNRLILDQNNELRSRMEALEDLAGSKH